MPGDLCAAPDIVSLSLILADRCDQWPVARDPEKSYGADTLAESFFLAAANGSMDSMQIKIRRGRCHMVMSSPWHLKSPVSNPAGVNRSFKNIKFSNKK